MGRGTGMIFVAPSSTPWDNARVSIPDNQGSHASYFKSCVIATDGPTSVLLFIFLRGGFETCCCHGPGTMSLVSTFISYVLRCLISLLSW